MSPKEDLRRFHCGSSENASSFSQNSTATMSKHSSMAKRLCKLHFVNSFQFLLIETLNFVNRSDGVLEDETRMPNIPRKLSSITFKNAVIDYWNYRIENVEKVRECRWKFKML